MTTLFTSEKGAIIARWAIALLCCLTACSRSPEIDIERPLRVAVAVEVSSLDPQITTSIEAIKIQSALFQTLVKVDPETGNILPAGATHWEISEDGLSYTFHLRKDAYWSNGEPVVAGDYVFASRRLLDPQLGAPFANLYFGITGAKEYLTGVIDDFANVGVKAIDSHTLAIRLSEPVPYMLSLLARPCVAALPADYIISRGGERSRTSGWSFSSGFPSSGPYYLDSWVVNKYIRLEKNPRYWNRDEIEIPSILFYPMESAYAQEQGFRAGALDVTSKLSAEQVPKYLGSKVITQQPEMGTFYIILNMDSPKLQSPELRHALYAAVDRQSIVEQLRRRGETPAYSFCPPLWNDLYPEVKIPSGKSILPTLDSLPAEPLKMIIPVSENNNIIAEALQEMWKQRLGVDVQIYRQEWKTYYDSRNRGQFDLCLATWIGDYYDPLTFLEMWKSDSPNNFCRRADLVFDEMLDRSGRMTSPAERMALLASAEERFLEDYPVIPIFYLSRVFLVTEDLENWPQSILNTVDYTRVRRIRH